MFENGDERVGNYVSVPTAKQKNKLANGIEKLQDVSD